MGENPFAERSPRLDPSAMHIRDGKGTMVRKPTTPPPRIDPIRLVDLHGGDASSLSAHGNYEGQRFTGIDLSSRDLRGIAFSECALSDIVAHEVDLRSAEFADTTIEHLNAPVLVAPRSQWRDVKIDYSRIGSAELYEAGWHSVHISNSKLGYLNLRGADLTDVLFTNCTIDELDLGGAHATRVAFTGTSIGTLDTTHASLTHVDLRGLQLHTLIGLEHLRGATMTTYQVSELAQLFAERIGITVQD